jgi:hypothetical protein
MKDRTAKKRKATRSIMAITAVALVTGAALYLFGEKNSRTAQAEGGATTETADAGARVLPTDPKPKVEPK